MRRRALPLMFCALASREALAQTSPPAAQEPAASAEGVEAARRLFREGVAAAQAERWTEAYERFSRTLAIRAAPIIRFNLAIACENLGRLVEAIDQYRQFARETPAGADPARVAAARARIEPIEQRLAMLRVEASGDAVRAFRLDGRAQNTALLGVDIPVDPSFGPLSGPFLLAWGACRLEQRPANKARANAAERWAWETPCNESWGKRKPIRELAHKISAESSLSLPARQLRSVQDHNTQRPSPLGGRVLPAGPTCDGPWRRRSTGNQANPTERPPFQPGTDQASSCGTAF